MSKIKEANVQYNDMKGTAAMDFHGNSSEFTTYAHDKGINLELYTPIGIRVYFGEIDLFWLVFIVLNTSTGLAHEISVTENQSDFFSRFKRLEIVLSLKHEVLTNYELGESIDTETTDLTN